MRKNYQFKGGTGVPHYKNTNDCRTVKMDVTSTVRIPMQQHIGAPCKPLVSKGDEVKVGQPIGASESYISTPVHSSVSGTVKKIDMLMFPTGNSVETVEIETDGQQEIWKGVHVPDVKNRSDFIKAVAESGLVGLGGAGFPAHVKLAPPEGKVIDTLIINAAECEPYITSDYRECIENPLIVIEGIKHITKYNDIEKVIIGVEDNKPIAIKSLTEAIGNNKKIKIISLKTRYPQGAEKMLIYSVTGRMVPTGGLPSDVGVIVLNINSVSFIAKYMKTGMPLMCKRVTVDGNIVKNPSNIEVLIGTPVGEVFNFCGGLTGEPSKVLMGGPMMGNALYTMDMPVMKYTNALLAFDSKFTEAAPESECIRCARCVDSCPMRLVPAKINKAALLEDIDMLIKLNAADCIECGCCSYICPANRNLAHSLRLAKAQLKKAKAKGIVI